jgi:hypothetical protein
VVVVAFEQERELPRTLRTLAPPYQRRLDSRDVEVVVVDNGSPRPLAALVPSDLEVPIRVVRLEDAPPSPAHAANVGIQAASGAVVGLVIDGARMASPGLLSTALMGARVAERAVVTAPAWHLGPSRHDMAEAAGYDATPEDALLEQASWRTDGYGLFSIATPAASCGRGLFGPMGESSSLFMSGDLWEELGGLDERFALPGGGLVNHDLYRRACSLPDAQLVVMLGEGTFHQVHGGAATSGLVSREAMRAEYATIRGEEHRPPTAEPIYVGTVPRQLLPHLERSAELARAREVSRR